MLYRLFDVSELDEIQALYQSSFGDAEGEKEGHTIGQLARDMLETTPSNQRYCFVATDKGRLTGAVIFTQMTFTASSIKAYILSPMAVATSNQKQGVGQALIRFGIDQLKADQVELLITYGDPNYYQRVGFNAVTIEEVPAPQPLSFPHGWIAQMLNGNELPKLSGTSKCVDALNQPHFW